MKRCPLCNEILFDMNDNFAVCHTRVIMPGAWGPINYFHYSIRKDKVRSQIYIPPYMIVIDQKENISRLHIFDGDFTGSTFILKLNSIIQFDSESDLRKRIKTILLFS